MTTADAKPHTFKTTAMETYQPPARPAMDSMGKRRQKLQAELLKLATKQDVKPTVDVKEHFKSTTLNDYAHEDIFPPTKKLGSTKPDEVL